MEEKLIEEEVAKRVEELVAKRVEEELEKRKDEIEAEVLRRVEEAKRIMEKQMLEEMERQREAELAAQKLKEVMPSFSGSDLGQSWHTLLFKIGIDFIINIYKSVWKWMKWDGYGVHVKNIV